MRTILLLPLLAALLAGCNRIEAERHAGPNLVLVTIDTLRADHVGAWGGTAVSTPVLDALAAEGVRFETTVAVAPLTLPSHATLFTGQLPPVHGIRHNGVRALPPDAVTLAERLREAGFNTGGFVGAMVLESRYGLDQGFDVYDDDAALRPGGPATFLERPAGEVTDAALAWLRQAPRPFFLWVHYFDPHGRYLPPEPWKSVFAKRPYDGEIAYVDSEIGRLLAPLRAAGELDHTLVTVTADHGESLGEHREPTHGYSLYDATQHVPWLVRGPGVPQGRSIGGVVSGADLTPTLLALLRLSPLESASGRDLTPHFAADAPAPETPVYAETLATQLEHGWAPLHAVRSPTHLYVQAPRPELYDVRRDPGQLENLLDATSVGELSGDPAAVQTAQAVAAMLDKIVATDIDLDAAASGVATLDDVERTRLAALGYVLPGEPVQSMGLDPKDGIEALALLHQGLEAAAAGRLGEAVALYQRARPRLPASALLSSALAQALLRLGRPAEALPEIQHATQVSPEVAGHHAVLGDTFRLLGQPDEAVVAYQEAASLDPQEPLAQVGLQWVRARAGDLKAAARHAEKALATPAGREVTAVRVGLVWEETGSFERARAAYRLALEERPGHSVAHVLLAANLLRTGATAEAEGHLEAAGDIIGHPRFAARIASARAAAPARPGP